MKLVKFLQKLNREQVTIELKNGTVVQGTVVGVDATMNCHLKKAKVTVRGKNPTSYSTLSVRGSTMRAWLLPESLNLDALLVDDTPKKNTAPSDHSFFGTFSDIGCLRCVLLAMATNVILNTLAHLAACGPCTGTFGRWKAGLQDDDADLWNDLTLVNSVPGPKPPAIPRVVEVVSVSGDDLSTLAYETVSSHQRSHSRGRGHRSGSRHPAPIEEEKSTSPSLKRTRKAHLRGADSRNHGDSDLELEQALEDIGLEDDRGASRGGGDAELESIMGPRSYASETSRGPRSHLGSTGRSIQRRIPSSHTAPVRLSASEAHRPPSLLQQKREEYHCAYAVVAASGSLGGGSQRSSRSTNASTTTSREDSKEEQLELWDSFGDELPDSCRSYDCGYKKSEADEEDYHDDGSSYSSVHRKLSFYRKSTKRSTLFRSSSNNSKSKSNHHHLSTKKGANRGDKDWLLGLEHGGSSTDDTYSTVLTQNCSSHSRNSYRSSSSQHKKYKPIF
ncbi:unnamed protein product [Pseudo-nitzschia multistriata]|uniref:snRNP core protein D1 n=1 Tax=Pseudo-nitzschia multistriata TaxID=183589 RepID=A0A448ZST7_9STRA|nr:unnamed protein product [Pseudo-nitzschia multistriata]